ncbi:hypothetical protein [Anaerocolumna sp. MB42-C2]|uniref:hypothetical protein n=1 Tax=Anaerocolumna sp. MB42-C2 TaxID=3070997 RepID=UPI0027DF24A9|nr:hypothetical protein [Anaerocolumna sp. MB42-C2]WMJ87539.1 hypothetical protein RBU59_26475 [Anaerocolumna sp. MB42-C2]
MKITNLAIIFFVLELLMITLIDIRLNNLTAITNKQVEYNKALDNAIDDGVMNLVEVDSNRKLILNKEVAVQQFFESLFANFGVIGNSHLENRLKNYIPVILVTDTDGFYINYSELYRSNDEVLTVSKWSEKIPYFYEDNNIIYKFTLGDYITLYDRSANLIYEGDYHDLNAHFPGTLLAKDAFDQIRRSVIIGKIEEKMNYYINLHNNIAEQYGITYRFWLPQINKADWYQTVNDISMLVIFQGYPYNAAGLDTYNRYALGGARIKKSSAYFITKINDLKVYHKDSCKRIADSGIPYYTKEECALEGAFPCPDCNP